MADKEVGVFFFCFEWALNCIVLLRIAINWLNCTEPHWVAWHRIALHWNASNYWFPLNWIDLHWIALHCSHRSHRPTVTRGRDKEFALNCIECIEMFRIVWNFILSLADKCLYQSKQGFSHDEKEKCDYISETSSTHRLNLVRWLFFSFSWQMSV